MASVQSSRAGKYARRGLLEDEPPDHVESAGEILIKQMVQKQTNTNITLRQQLQSEKKFERGVGFVTLDKLGTGTSSLREFEEKQQRVESMLEMEGKEWGREEVPFSKTEEQYSQTGFSYSGEATAVRRQEWELAMSVKPDSLETRLYQFAVNGERVRELRPPDHPVHQLAAMEQRLRETADPQALAKTYRRKRRQLVAAQAQPQGVHYKAPDRHQSLWDAIERPTVVEKRPRRPEKIASCKKQTLYTVRGGKIVQFGVEEDKVENDKSPAATRDRPSGQAFVTLQPSIETPQVCGRLTEEEIKKLPRFHNYDKGKVSKTLYIKNLSTNVTEADLAAMFNHFQERNQSMIIFRLMTGKMRGQAFITFSSSDIAAEALETVNGTILKGKPMVIQYGKQLT